MEEKKILTRLLKKTVSIVDCGLKLSLCEVPSHVLPLRGVLKSKSDIFITAI